MIEMGKNKILTSKLFQNKNLLLLGIILISLIFRLRNIALCDIRDRCQMLVGMTANLPPLYHYIVYPFWHLFQGLWYTGAIVNLILTVIIIVLYYRLGKDIKNEYFGLLMAFLAGIFPQLVIFAKHISPETTETLFLTLIIYFFIKLEILGSKKNFNLNQVLLFLSIAIGLFSKQQTFVVLGPLMMYGILKYRFKIIYQPTYYIIALASVPYFLFMIANPQLLAAIIMYVTEPGVKYHLFSKILNSITGLYLFWGGIFFFLMLFYFLRLIFNIRKGKKIQRIDQFMIFYFIIFNIFYMVSQAKYIHFLAVPLIFFAASIIYDLRKYRFISIGLLVLIVSYTFIIFYLMIPGLSINTFSQCEKVELGEESILINILKPTISDTAPFYNIYDRYLNDELFKDEKYVIIGGYVDQGLKCNIHKRLYYPSVVNSERFDEINYVILAEPYLTTYRGTVPWEKEYIEYILNNSELVFREENYVGDRGIEIYRIHTRPEFNLTDYDLRERGIESLGSGDFTKIKGTK